MSKLNKDCFNDRVNLIKSILSKKPRVEFAHCEHCGFSWLPFGETYQDECPKCHISSVGHDVDGTDEEMLGVTLSDDEMY